MSVKPSINILIVDDQPGKILTYEAILQDLGENLISANSAKEAFDHLLRNDFAVVLVDVCMPDLDGYQLASMIREHPQFEKTPIIFISAIYLSELDRLRGYESGAVDYVPVPIVPEILRAKVRVFVDLHRKTRELERLNRELEHRVAERTAELLSSAERLRESEERLRMASEAAEFGTYEVNFSSQTIHCSPQMKRLLGCKSEGDFNLDRFFELIDAEHRAAVRRCMIASQRDDEDRHQIEFRVMQPDGTARWVLDRGRVFFSEQDAQPIRVIGTVLDVTDRKQAEERQSILMAELDHRVKNILANISAIANLSSKRPASVDAFVKALDARIQAVARAHALLRRDSWIGIEIDSYVREILAPFIVARGKNFIIEGESLSLLPRAAQSLALVLHELATNAAKYGALSIADGVVRITWSRVNEPSTRDIRLTWEEIGGPKIKKPAGQGFGSTVIRASAHELGARLSYEFRPEGVFFALEAQMEQITKLENIAPAIQEPSIVDGSEFAKAQVFQVLIVEDEPLVALQVKNELEAVGHKVIGLAASVSQALSLVENSDFDVAFLDIRLGDTSSIKVAERLSELGIPFIFGSGFEDNSILPSYLRNIPRLSKPYETERLSRLLNDLAGAATRREMAGHHSAS